MDADAGWTEERIELIKRTIVPKGIPTDEFLLFVEQCQRSGLDPLLKQAYCVPREVKGEKLLNPDGSPKKERWSDGSLHDVYQKITRYEFQPSRDGMLVRANRFPDFLGMQASEVYAEDDILITYAEDGALSSVRHAFNPAKRKGALVGAWARVARHGKLPVLVWADFAAFVQKSPLWKDKPAVMICKVAEAMALRKAYPEAFGGLYIAGERPDDGVHDDEAETPSPSPHPIPRIRAVLPEESATRQAAPALVVSPEPQPVSSGESGGASAHDATTFETLMSARDEDDALVADAIISEAGAVATAAIESERAEAALTRARADLSSLAVRARKLPRGSPARTRVSKALEDIQAQLFGEAKW